MDFDSEMMMGGEGSAPMPGDELVSAAPGSITTVSRGTSLQQVSEENAVGMEEACAPGRLDSKGPSSPMTEEDAEGGGGTTARPGAVAVQQRAVGHRPAWHRRISAHVAAPFRQGRRSSSMASNSDLRRARNSISRNSAASEENNPKERQDSQSRLSPEINRRRGSSFFAFWGAAEYVEAECELIELDAGNGNEEAFEGDVCRGIYILLGCGLLLVATVVGVTVGVTSGNNNQATMVNAPPTPAQAPIVDQPTYFSGRQAQLVEQLKYLSSSDSDESVFDDSLSPQSVAVAWLANADRAAIPETDQQRLESRYALATFYFATTGGSWDDDLGFLANVHECNWTSVRDDNGERQGVTCNDQDEIVSLVIDGNNLEGFIPEELKALTSLGEVRITNQTLRNSDVTSLSSVRAFGQMPSLKVLDLSGNRLSRSLPESFGEGNLPILEELYLNENRFFGSIPNEYEALTQLKKLHLQNNELTGNADQGTWALNNLIELRMGGNPSLGLGELFFINLLELRVLDLSQVHFGNKRLPVQIERLTNLEELTLSDAELIGSIPSTLGKLTALKSFIIERNNLMGGPFPWSSFGDPTTLVHLNMRNTGLSGELPQDIGRFINLTMLNLSRNTEFGGSIPESIGGLTKLEELHLKQDNMTGILPSTIGDMTSLKKLYLESNSLSGEIPAALANLESLEVVGLSGNLFTAGNIEFFCETPSPTQVFTDCTLDCSCCTRSGC